MKFCIKCGKEIQDDSVFCPFCGSKQESENQKETVNQEPIENQKQKTEETAQKKEKDEVSPKSRTITLVLALIVGFLGIHRFYVGKTGTGVLQLLISVIFGSVTAGLGIGLGWVWALIDIFVIVAGNFTDKQGRKILSWEVK